MLIIYCSSQRSFQDPVVINCDAPDVCLEKVISNKLYRGFVPIVVSHKKANRKAEISIFNFFKNKPFANILRVYVERNKNVEIAQYLNGYRCGGLGYPFVAAVIDNKLIHHLSLGYDINALSAFLIIAQSPDIVSKNNCKFTEDLTFIVNEIIRASRKPYQSAMAQTLVSQRPKAETFNSQRPKAETSKSQKPEAETLKPQRPKDEDVVMIETLGSSGMSNWWSSLYDQTVSFLDLNANYKRKRSPSPTTTSGQTGPDEKKMKKEIIVLD